MAGLLHHSAETPDKPALVFGDGTFVETYAQLETRSRSIALALKAAGLKRGDCVALLMQNSPAFFDVYWATQRLGLYLTPLNWHTDISELAYIVENCDAGAIICDAALSETAQNLRAQTGAKVTHFFSVGGDIAGYDPVDQAIVEPGTLDEEPSGSVMVYSSGTTGRPKGIRRPLPKLPISDPAVVDATTHVMRTFGFRGDDVYLCPAPFYHAAPIRSCSAMQQLGATVVVMERFDAETVLRIIDRYKVTVAQFVPTHFKRMLSLPADVRDGYDVSSLRVAVHAAAPCPKGIKLEMIEWWGPILLEYYAGTEGGGVMIDSHDWQARPGSVGRPWKGLEVAIEDPSGAMVTQPHLEGPIYFKNVPAGGLKFEYYKDPEKTASVFRGDWFSLGDIGYLDDHGFLFLTDRKSNLIISGGVNIYPQEVEDLLAAHADVFDVAVIGIPDADLGERVHALVIPAQGKEPGEDFADALLAHTHSHLAKFKCPRSIEFVTELPRTQTGKLMKKKLVAAYQSSS